MHKSSNITIRIFEISLSKNNWSKLLKFIINLLLKLTTIYKPSSIGNVEIFTKVDTILATEKVSPEVDNILATKNKIWLENREKS